MSRILTSRMVQLRGISGSMTDRTGCRRLPSHSPPKHIRSEIPTPVGRPQCCGTDKLYERPRRAVLGFSVPCAHRCIVFGDGPGCNLRRGPCLCFSPTTTRLRFLLEFVRAGEHTSIEMSIETPGSRTGNRKTDRGKVWRQRFRGRQ